MNKRRCCAWDANPGDSTKETVKATRSKAARERLKKHAKIQVMQAGLKLKAEELGRQRAEAAARAAKARAGLKRAGKLTVLMEGMKKEAQELEKEREHISSVRGSIIQLNTESPKEKKACCWA